MLSLSQVTVENIPSVKVVHTAENARRQMKYRKNFGISFCVEGSIRFEQDGHTIIADRDHAAFLPRNGCYWLKGLEHSTTILVDFSSSEKGLSDSLQSIPLSDPEGCEKILRNMLQLFPVGQNRAKVMSLLYELLHRMDAERSRSYDPIRPAVEYINRHYTDSGVTNTKLAEICAISEVYLRKCFISRFGLSPHRYLLDLRMSRAKQLLCEGKMSISELAEACGFSGGYHFSRTFKTRCGMTPSQYAAQSRMELI